MEVNKLKVQDDRTEDFRMPTVKEMSEETLGDEIEVYNAVWELYKKIIRKKIE